MVKDRRSTLLYVVELICLAGCAIVILGCNTAEPTLGESQNVDDQAPSPRLFAIRDESPDPDESVESKRQIAKRPDPDDDREGAGRSHRDVFPSEPLDDNSAESWKPAVFMSQAHDESCLRKVGDRLPPIKLLDLAGEPHALDSFYGGKLTVVIFWNSRLAYARDQYARIVDEVVLPYSGAGVNAVAVNIRQLRDDLQPIESETTVGLANLMDVDGRAFAEVATGKLPRTYLLDRFGTILWMDIEYSRSTRRELANAIRYYISRET